MTQQRIKTFASIMMAVVTVFGAIVACRSSIASEDAGNADFDGLVAAIRAQETAIANYVTVYEHYRAYTDYVRLDELGNIVADEPPSSTLGRMQREAWGVAQGLQFSFFPPRYLNPDGGYAIQRELDEAWARAAQQDDLDPAPHFSTAEAARLKATLLAGTLIILAVAFWFFTLAQAIRNRLKYLFLLGGLTSTVIGLLVYLVVEVAL